MKKIEIKIVIKSEKYDDETLTDSELFHLKCDIKAGFEERTGFQVDDIDLQIIEL